MRRLIPPVVAGPLALAAGVLVLAGCSADTADFKEQGEKFLEGDEVRERFGMVRMSDAECQEPADTNKDTIYTCTATGSDGNTWAFTIEITGSTSLRVTSGEVVTAGSTTTTSAAPPTSAAPTSSAATTTTSVAPATAAASPTTVG